MEKNSFISLLLGVIGRLLFAIGMCMVMTYDMMIAGISVGVVGIILLICLIPIVRGGKVKRKFKKNSDQQYKCSTVQGSFLSKFNLTPHSVLPLPRL